MIAELHLRHATIRQTIADNGADLGVGSSGDSGHNTRSELSAVSILTVTHRATCIEDLLAGVWRLGCQDRRRGSNHYQPSSCRTHQYSTIEPFIIVPYGFYTRTGLKALSMNRILLLLITGGLAFGQDWPVYGGDAGGARYSSLTEINRSNMARLKTAWTYHTGDVSDG